MKLEVSGFRELLYSGTGHGSAAAQAALPD